MNQCKFYHIYDQHSSHRDAVTGVAQLVKTPVGTCWGTKNREQCNCSGNVEACERSNRTSEKLSLSARVESLIPKIRCLDLAGFIEDEVTRSEIITELFAIKTELEKG